MIGLCFLERNVQNRLLIFVYSVLLLNAQTIAGSQKRIPPLNPIPKSSLLSNISAQEVFNHMLNFLQFSEMAGSYDSSRSKSRDYIVQMLTTGPQKFAGDQVFLHKFDWTDTTEHFGVTTRTTWTGVNILAWTNTSALSPNKTYSVVAARYDSSGWYSQEFHGDSYSCTTNHPNPKDACSRGSQTLNLTPRLKVTALSLDLFGACVLLQLAKLVASYQQELKNRMESMTALEAAYFWDKDDPSTIETGIFEEIPVLFIFFDHESIGNLGSQVWTEYYDFARQLQEGKIYSLTGIDFTGKWIPHDPLNQLKPRPNVPVWQSQMPNMFLSPDWISQLLMTQTDRELAANTDKKIFNQKTKKSKSEA